MLLREYAAELFLKTLARVDVARCMTMQTLCEAGRLRIGEAEYRLADFDEVLLIGIGKAAIPMVDVAVKVIAPQLTGAQRLHGVVAAGTVPDTVNPQLRYYAAGHPFPDATSRRAAEHILNLCRACGERTLVLFLISGGASAMVEKPLLDSVSIAETASFYKALVHSGLRITQMNCLRKHFSAVKGGRLAQAVGNATQCTVIVSDVPDGFLDAVASGPSMPDRSTVEECRHILESSRIADTLSPEVRRLLLRPDLPETVKPQSHAFERASHLCLLSNADLLRHAASLAEADGFHVVIDNACDDWAYQDAGDYLLDRMQTLRSQYPRVCLLSGGEVSVRLPETVALGGRNQQFALWSALRLQRTGEPITLLSAGTDGLDGNSPAAGAVVDNLSCEQAERMGLDPAGSFDRFDSFSFFRETGGVLFTGPTGNNVRDLRILLSVP